MPRTLTILTLLLTSACVSHSERTQVITTHGAPVSATKEVYDPYSGEYVTLPAGASQVTYYDKQVTSPGITVIVKPDCRRETYPPRRTFPKDRAVQQAPHKSNGVTIHCR